MDATARKRWLRALRHPKKAPRLDALRRLAREPGPDLCMPVCALLDDPRVDWVTVGMVLSALGPAATEPD